MTQTNQSPNLKDTHLAGGLQFIGVFLSVAMLAGCETLSTIDSGVYTTVEAVTERDRVTGRRTISLVDRHQQIAKGNQFIADILTEARANGRRINGDYDEQAYRRINRIFNQLHQVSHLGNEKWEAILIEDDEWNAFTTGGTYFVINSGLEADLQDDNELANIIAHEMSHTVANHVFERLSYLKLGSIGGSRSAKRGTFQAAFSHENEAEADMLAVLYCALAGYDPYAGARIWQRMHQRSGSRAGHVQSHPMNNERAELAATAAKMAAPYYLGPGVVNSNYQSILTRNELFTTRQISEAEAGKGGGFLSLLETSLETYQQKQKARTEEQRQQNRIEFIRAVNEVSSLDSSMPIKADTWRFTLTYRGNIRLTDLSFRATFSGGSNRISKIRHLDGVLSPNTTYQVDFYVPEVDVRRVDPANVQIVYDNARQYP